MRTAVRKLKALNRRIRRPSANIGKIKNKVGHLYARSVKNIKQKPYKSLGAAALGLGALSGLVLWLKTRR